MARRAEWSWNCRCGQVGHWFVTRAAAETAGTEHRKEHPDEVMGPKAHIVTTAKDRGPASLEALLRF